jgi:hypothetical protein
VERFKLSNDGKQMIYVKKPDNARAIARKMPRAVARTPAIAHKLYTAMNGLSQCRFSHWPVLWGHVPQFNLAFSLEEAPTFGRGFFTQAP